MLSYLQDSLLLCPKITEASARYFCGAKKLHTEPRKISAHLSCIGPLGLSRTESDWATGSNQSQKGSRRRVPPGSWSISVHISCFSRFNLWSTLTPEEFDVKTLISWPASPLAHWDSNCPIETWHNFFCPRLKHVKTSWHQTFIFKEKVLECSILADFGQIVVGVFWLSDVCFWKLKNSKNH